MATDTDMQIRRVDDLLRQGFSEVRHPDGRHCDEVLEAIKQHEGQVAYLTRQIGSISGATSMNLHRLDVLTKQLAALKHHQNYQLAPISRIPSELLHHIFSLLVKHYVDPYHLSNPSRSPRPLDLLEWVSITHVCHEWRQIMINDPQFWAQLFPSRRPKWTREMISRSLKSQLFVKVDCFDMTPDGHSAMEHIFGELFRIRELSLIVPHINTVLQDLTKPAPNLRCFALRIFRQLTAPSLPSNIFAGTASQLRQLSLEGCQLPLESPLWSRLTHLQLVSARLDMTVSQFMNILRGMSELKELTLNSAFPLDHRREQLIEPMTPVHLGNLVILSISQPSDFASILLEHFELPQQPQTYLALQFRRPTAEALGVVLRRLIIQLTTPDPIYPRCLIIEDFSPRSMRIAACKERSIRELHFTLRLTDTMYGLTEEDYSSIKNGFIGLSPVRDHVQTLHLHGVKAGSMVAGIYFPEVDMIVADRAAALSWLSRARRAADTNDLPKLRSIHFTEPLSVEIQGVETSGSLVLAAFIAYLRRVNQNDFKLALVHLPLADKDDPNVGMLHDLVWNISFSDIPVRA